MALELPPDQLAPLVKAGVKAASTRHAAAMQEAGERLDTELGILRNLAAADVPYAAFGERARNLASAISSPVIEDPQLTGSRISLSNVFDVLQSAKADSTELNKAISYLAELAELSARVIEALVTKDIESGDSSFSKALSSEGVKLPGGLELSLNFNSSGSEPEILIKDESGADLAIDSPSEDVPADFAMSKDDQMVVTYLSYPKVSVSGIGVIVDSDSDGNCKDYETSFPFDLQKFMYPEVLRSHSNIAQFLSDARQTVD